MSDNTGDEKVLSVKERLALLNNKSAISNSNSSPIAPKGTLIIFYRNIIL